VETGLVSRQDADILIQRGHQGEFKLVDTGTVTRGQLSVLQDYCGRLSLGGKVGVVWNEDGSGGELEWVV